MADYDQQRKDAFAARLRSLRQEAGISQGKLAKELGVSTWTVSSWECGKGIPGFDSLDRLGDYFHTSFGYLMGHSNEHHSENEEEPEPTPWIEGELMADAQVLSEYFRKMAVLSNGPLRIVMAAINAAYKQGKISGNLDEPFFDIKVIPKKLKSRPKHDSNTQSK